MLSTVLVATMALGTVAAVLGENNHNHIASTQPKSEASVLNINKVVLPQVAIAVGKENVEPDRNSVVIPYGPPFEIVKRNDAQANVLIEDFLAPQTTINYLQAQATPVNDQNKDAVQKNHPISVPQMQSTMAPVEAAQTFRSFQSARASISAMSKAAARKGPAAATMAAAAASASASLAKSQPEVEKSLVRACKGDTQCEKFYKNGLKSVNDAGKGNNIVDVNHGDGADVAVRISTIMVAFGCLVAAFVLM